MLKGKTGIEVCYSLNCNLHQVVDNCIRKGIEIEPSLRDLAKFGIVEITFCPTMKAAAMYAAEKAENYCSCDWKGIYYLVPTQDGE